MLKIRINNIDIDLPLNAQLEFHMESPFLNYDKMQGSYGYTLNVPGTAKNKLAFNFPEQLTNLNFNSFELQPAEVYDDDIFIMNASAKLSNVTGNLNTDSASYTLMLGTDIGLFGDRRLQTNLSSFDFGTLTKSSTSVNPANWWNAEIDDMNANDYLTRNFAAFSVYVHDIPEYFSWYNLPFFTTQGNIPRYEKSFHPYLVWVVRTIFKQLGFELLNRSIITDRDFNQLAIICLQRYYLSPTAVNKHLPNATVSDLFNSIRVLCNAGIFVSRTDQTVKIITYNDIVDSSEVIDWTGKVLANYTFEPKVYDGFELTQAPDANDTIELNSDLDFNENVLVSSATTLAGLPTPTEEGKEYGLVYNENCLYTEATTRAQLAYNFSKYNQGKGDIKAESMASGIEMLNFDSTIHPTKLITGYHPPLFLTPRINVPDIWAHTAIRLAFYRGMCPSSTAENYPLGTSGMHDFMGNQVGQWHLGWQGNGGLHQKFWARMFEHRKKYPYLVKFNLKLDYNDILNIDFSKKHQIGNTTWILASIDFKLPLKEPCEVKFFRIK